MTDFPSLSGNESENYQVTTIVGENRWKVNSYLVTSKKTGDAFLIDSGGESAELLSVLEDIFPGTIEFILLTHGHFDHLSSAAAICVARNLPCIVHPNDMKLARHAPFYAISFDGSTLQLPKPLLKMELPESTYCSAWSISVVETPGHTAGSCCYILDNFVFTGDTLIKEAIGRTDQPGGNSEAITESIMNMLKMAPDNGIIFPGHGQPWAVVEARAWWEKSKDKLPQHDSFQ